jgi:glycosyltransferase involved in cell wall biosynthesis
VTPKKKPIRIDIWHNILWSKYKGEVFSSLYALNDIDKIDIRFLQIAETEGQRVGLSGIDVNHHRYPYELIFHGSVDRVSIAKRIGAIFSRTYNSDAELVILAGYEKPEFWLQLLFLLIRRKKIAVFCDSTIYDQKQKFLRGLLKRFFFRSVNGIFCYGTRSKEYVTHYGANAKNVYTRCQAAALPLGYSREEALSARLSMAPAPHAPRYLYVGRLSPEKGLDTLIAAFAGVKQRIAAATLVIVGSGPAREALEAQTRSLGLEEAVVFTGSKASNELFQEYSKATCLVLPSRSEPWGLVVNEALSYGCPAIVSHHCGCVPELVMEGTTGFSHAVDDADDLMKKMIAAPSQFSDITGTARHCIQLISTFSSDAAASQILSGLREIMSI